MSVRSETETAAIPRPTAKERQGSPLTRGVVTGYLSLIVLIPLAAVVWRSTDGGVEGLLRAISNPQAFAALSLWGKVAHNYLAFPFTLGILVMLLLWVRDNLPDRRDIDWATAQARRTASTLDPSVFDFLHALLTTDRPRTPSPERLPCPAARPR